MNLLMIAKSPDHQADKPTRIHGEKACSKVFWISSRRVMIKHKYPNRTLKQTLPHLIFCF
ncbi:hypothetical protein HanXRQr2_Chr14g0664041 [Helianthus annuus]|uniref:Uncharacterized protein n=1 Tax=Helianthus annuus TaxID=4232 RepID=A0A9K3EC81_HELAN|nr:hypothetical protein HanXRQr2_Chr14g0664041 [Helianthus annuus]KAJ0842055.1 hypothetical protein HanPSC8_Chr14g0637331 [Helianthus annuus]